MDIIAPTPQQDIEQMNEEDIKNLLRAKGQKLGLLLAGSNLPDDVKEAIVTIVPELSLQQIDDLLNALEGQYLLQKSGGATAQEEFQKKLAVLLLASEEKQEANAQDTLAKLDALGKQIPE